MRLVSFFLSFIFFLMLPHNLKIYIYIFSKIEKENISAFFSQHMFLSTNLIPVMDKYIELPPSKFF
jgi:hypothetical protein